MNSPALLSFENIRVSRGGKRVLELDRLDIQKGGNLVVIGPNGAGKSTLLLVAAGLLKPETGRLLRNDQDVYSGNLLAYRRKTALVLQDPLLLDMTVFDNVAAGLRFRGVEKKVIAQKVNPWLERLDIAHLANRRARAISGGEAQRASLARALVLEPDVLLLDEPFSALDAPTRIRLIDDFQELVRQNAITTLLVTHDLNEALQLGNRVAVILEGKLKQIGSPHEVFNMPVDTEVAAFVGVETLIPADVTGLKDGMVFMKAGDYNLEAVGESVTKGNVLLCLRPEDITLWKDGEVPHSSARNRMSGIVQRCTVQGALVRVLIDCGFPVTVLITRSSWIEMGIQAGTRVTATFKATSVHIIPR